jgi:hypothetical protein
MSTVEQEVGITRIRGKQMLKIGAALNADDLSLCSGRGGELPIFDVAHSLCMLPMSPSLDPARGPAGRGARRTRRTRSQQEVRSSSLYCVVLLKPAQWIYSSHGRAARDWPERTTPGSSRRNHVEHLPGAQQECAVRRVMLGLS